MLRRDGRGVKAREGVGVAIGSSKRLVGSVIVGCLLLTACAQTPANPAQNQAGGGAPQPAAGPHGNLRVAFAREPETLSPKFLPGGGAGDYTWLFNSALAVRDLSYTPHPMIARELPSQASGDWVFAFQVYTDDAMPVGVRAPESLMSKVEARDDQTLVITWKELYTGANTL